MIGPPFEGGFTLDAKASANNGMGAALFAAYGPIEKGYVGAGRAQAIGIKQVIGRSIILVHGFLDHAEAQGFCVEIVVAGGIGGDGGEVVQAFELHFVSYEFSQALAIVTSFWVRLCPVGSVSCVTSACAFLSMVANRFALLAGMIGSLAPEMMRTGFCARSACGAFASGTMARSRLAPVRASGRSRR